MAHRLILKLIVLVVCKSQNQQDCAGTSYYAARNYIKKMESPVPTSKGGFINSGTPIPVNFSFDCAVRKYAYQYGQQIQPRHGNFVDLFDALQLSQCNMTRPIPTERKIYKHIKLKSTTTQCIYYINSENGNDSNNGTTINTPFKSIEKGIIETRYFRNNNNNTTIKCILNLMKGIYYLNKTISLTSNDSYLTIQNYNGERAIISGGIPLQFGNNKWNLYEYKPINWTKYNGYSNIYQIFEKETSNDLVKYLGTHVTFELCLEKAKRNNITFYSITYFDELIENITLQGHCYGVVDQSWAPIVQNNAITAKYEGRNIWYNKVKNNSDFDILGLRLNNLNEDNKQIRGIRARYPNGNPENSMQYYALSGWITYPTIWKQLNISYYNFTTIIIKHSDYPNVIWPMTGPGNTNWTGEGDWGEFFMGKGGSCDNKNIQPNYGYWCSAHSPRNGNLVPYEFGHNSPYSLIIDPISIINSNKYTNDLLSNAIIHAWRPEHWFSWMWDIKSYNNETNELLLNNGGFQGAEGYSKYPYGGEWYIENVFIELDSPNEYFYNKTNNILYYYYNSTNGIQEPPSDNIQFIATNLKILFAINGTQLNPVMNISFYGLEFRDTTYTYMDIHGFPSGGDWSIQRQGAITINGSINININYCLFTRLDGIGIFLNGYNRNTIFENNDFEFIGDSAMASWGYTHGRDEINKLIPNGGPDGRDGNQPRHTIIRNNLIHEIGIWEKQSAMWFQALTCQTILENNIFFNGPRAAINFNDGFGGNNSIKGNLLLNACRESGDHGPFNTWDRQPYITTIGDGYTSSVIPGFNHIYNNFIIGTYQTLACIDTDDGGSYYKTFNNFFVYGNEGLKSDFSGHNNYHFNNIYAYLHKAFTFWCGGANDIFANNTVISWNKAVYTSNCSIPISKGTTNFTLFNNSIYLPDPSQVSICNMPFWEWQMLGNDQLSTINPAISDQQIIELAMAKLNAT